MWCWMVGPLINQYTGGNSLGNCWSYFPIYHYDWIVMAVKPYFLIDKIIDLVMAIKPYLTKCWVFILYDGFYTFWQFLLDGKLEMLLNTC